MQSKTNGVEDNTPIVNHSFIAHPNQQALDETPKEVSNKLFPRIDAPLEASLPKKLKSLLPTLNGRPRTLFQPAYDLII